MADVHFTPYPAPYFSLIDGDKIRRELSHYKDSWLVLYFYPKDETPGCTLEACEFRDAKEELLAMKAYVVGVSMDAPASHDSFRLRHDLNFPLLSDPLGKTTREYGAWGRRMLGGEGTVRKTFLIDPKGMVRKVYDRITPGRHAVEIMMDLEKLQAADSQVPEAGV